MSSLAYHCIRLWLRRQLYFDRIRSVSI